MTELGSSSLSSSLSSWLSWLSWPSHPLVLTGTAHTGHTSPGQWVVTGFSPGPLCLSLSSVSHSSSQCPILAKYLSALRPLSQATRSVAHTNKREVSVNSNIVLWGSLETWRVIHRVIRHSGHGMITRREWPRAGPGLNNNRGWWGEQLGLTVTWTQWRQHGYPTPVGTLLDTSICNDIH